MSFGEILIKNNVIDNDLLIKAKDEASKQSLSLEEVLLKYGVNEDSITEAKSEAFGIPIRKISETTQIPFDILKNIPEESAMHYKFAPLGITDGVMEVGVLNPDDQEAQEAMQFLSTKLNIPFKVFLLSTTDLNKILGNYQSLGGEATKVLGELESAISEQKNLSSLPEETLKGNTKLVEDAPTTKMVDVILRHAIEGSASDIHIEPVYDKLKVRFRVDGVLHTSLTLPKNVHDSVVARIKILTNMKLDEKRKPQDGRFETTVENNRVDFRVSTFPTFFGEKIVIRILDSEKGLAKLEDIGVTGRNLKEIEEAVKQPYGMVLLTGPTGSGKTTTLYSMLRMIDREKLNVVSLEDPIEYNLDGANQSQVRPEIDYDFANGLRSILRQDPDVIMVGEIRDGETARLAIQAALTGHLVLSTLHTNNAVGVIPRLIDMGVDPFLIPSTLILAIAQRLVRKLCPDSKKPLAVKDSVKETIEKELLGIPDILKSKIKIPKEIYESMPSATCPRGTMGRTAVFEVIKMTPELEKIILSEASETAIETEARRQGMFTMREDGVLKILDGTIGFSELNEVVS